MHFGDFHGDFSGNQQVFISEQVEINTVEILEIYYYFIKHCSLLVKFKSKEANFDH
jgi:hypothetical protein